MPYQIDNHIPSNQMNAFIYVSPQATFNKYFLVIFHLLAKCHITINFIYRKNLFHKKTRKQQNFKNSFIIFIFSLSLSL